MKPTFWQKKRVLVTGHTGFKGSWLSVWLQMLGAEVTGLSIGTVGTPNLFEEAEVASGMTSLMEDVRDTEFLTRLLRSFRPEVVIHMAAQSLVRRSYADPVETLSTNVMGTVSLLEALRQVSPDCAVLVVTTDKCYQNTEAAKAYREDDPLGGFDPYSTSKACAELVADGYRKSYFSPWADGGSVLLATARAGNVIGGGDWSEDRLIPDFVRAVTRNESLRLRSASSTRPWQHVLDVLNGYLTLLEHMRESPSGYCEAWNFGPPPSHDTTVSVVADQLVRQWGKTASWSVDTEKEPLHEANMLALDSTKANERLGWYPHLNLEETIAKTVDWYQVYCRSMNARAVTKNQIREFTDQLAHE